MTAGQLARDLPIISQRNGLYDTYCPAHPDEHSSVTFRDSSNGLVVHLLGLRGPQVPNCRWFLPSLMSDFGTARWPTAVEPSNRRFDQ
jgi:hypothetical protein